MLGLLIFYMSVFVPMLEPKFALALAGMCLFVDSRKLLKNCVPLILAIIAYGVLIALLFPAPKPNIGLILQRSLFNTDCVLLAVAGLSGRSIHRYYVLFLGILLLSIAGVAGDLMGHDMTALLPFEMPNDAYFDQVTTDAGGSARVRGFFAESGVLGAVCMGISTCTALGALVLIRARVHVRAAMTALFSVLIVGGAILCLTVTKSGMVMVIAGMIGFLARLLFSRDGRCRALAIGALLAAVLGAALFLFAAPSSLTWYFKGEVDALIHIRDAGPAVAMSHSGMFTRMECWKAAFYSVFYYPLGVGPWGLGSVLDKSTNVHLTHEMQLFFSQGVFGLKNALADLMEETGLVGLGLLFLWLWRGFWVPSRKHYDSGERVGVLIAALYWASAFLSLALMVSCELYPCLALLVVFKLHADVVADACTADRTGATISAEES